MSEAPWLLLARRYVGVKEIAGPQHHPAILALLDAADGLVDGKRLQGIADDETPWCASFVSAILELSGYKSTRSAWARSYLNWGQKLIGPAIGAIAVLERGPSSGHVGFVVGRDGAGDVLLLGGNQGDQVKISAFDMQRVLGFRWPDGERLPDAQKFFALPLVASAGKSTSEA